MQSNSGMSRGYHYFAFLKMHQAPLSLPIVACRLGLLYNKEAVIKYILAKKAVVSMQHTKNLKDFKDVKFMVCYLLSIVRITM